LHRLTRRLGTLPAALLALGALASPASAALTAAGPVDPAIKAPAFYQDANGLQLGVCHPGTVNCGPAAPGEDFYYMATSTFTAPNGGTAMLILNMTIAPNASGDPAVFNRVRVQLDGFPAGDYTITHPYGTDVVSAPAGRRGRTTIDIGCAVTAVGPCDFAAALAGRFGPFLTAAPGATPAAPAGFIGDAVVEVPVVGSPTGNNFFRVEGSGLPAGGVQSNTFALMGKLFGGAVPAFGHSGNVAFADQLVGTPSANRTITVTSNGIPGAGSDLSISGVTLGGANAADYSLADTCAGKTLASGATCTIGVTFNPSATGARNATITVADNTAAGTHAIALTGNGTTPAPAAAAPAAVTTAPPASHPTPPVLAPVAPSTTSALRVAGLHVAKRVRLRQARGRGIVATFSAPAAASVARVRLLKGRKLVATKLVALTDPGAQTVHLRARHARAGRYVLEVAIGTKASALTRPSRALVTLVR